MNRYSECSAGRKCLDKRLALYLHLYSKCNFMCTFFISSLVFFGGWVKTEEACCFWLVLFQLNSLQLTRCSPVHRHRQSAPRRHEGPGEGIKTTTVYHPDKFLRWVWGKRKNVFFEKNYAEWWSICQTGVRRLAILTHIRTRTTTFPWSAITTSSTSRSATSRPDRSTAISRWNRFHPNRSVPSLATSSRDAERI